MQNLTRFARIVAIAFVAVFALSATARAQRVVMIPVNIDSVPPGAAVYLDTESETTRIGVTPIVAARVPSGSHTLIFRLNNYEEARVNVTVARRRETFRAVLHALASVELSAGSSEAVGATVTVDDQPVSGGTLGPQPIRIDNLPPGRHEIRAQREGFAIFRQWIELRPGEAQRVAISLQRIAPGEAVIRGGIEGSPIFVDDQPTGRVSPNVVDVPPGSHVISVRPSSGPRYDRPITVESGQRVEIDVPAVVQRGRIEVIVDVPGAMVRIDSQTLQPGTYIANEVEAGEHIVTVLLEGHVTVVERGVVVRPGETTRVSAVMVRETRPAGPISIRPNVATAVIVVDGRQVSTPHLDTAPVAGPHQIRVTAPGYEPQTIDCNNTSESQDCNREVVLQASPQRLRVTLGTTVRQGVQATIQLDAQEPVPFPAEAFEAVVAPGEHRVIVAAPGYETYTRSFPVTAGTEVGPLNVVLVDSTVVAAAQTTTHSALPIPENHPMVDASIGWPHFVELRLSIGLHPLVDAGFGVRSFGRLTEFEGRVRVGTRIPGVRQLAVGGQLRFGGGIGPDTSTGVPNYNRADATNRGICDPSSMTPVDLATPATPRPNCSNQDQDPINPVGGRRTFSSGVNSFFLSLDANVSLLLEPLASVTLWLGLDMSTDQYSGHARDSSSYADWGPSADRICTEPSGTSTGLDCGRQDMARLRLGGAVEFNIPDTNWAVWGLFEGVLWQANDHRRVYSDIVGQAVDLRIYPRLGLTYKF